MSFFFGKLQEWMSGTGQEAEVGQRALSPDLIPHSKKQKAARGTNDQANPFFSGNTQQSFARSTLFSSAFPSKATQNLSEASSFVPRRVGPRRGGTNRATKKSRVRRSTQRQNNIFSGFEAEKTKFSNTMSSSTEGHGGIFVQVGKENSSGNLNSFNFSLNQDFDFTATTIQPNAAQFCKKRRVDGPSSSMFAKDNTSKKPASPNATSSSRSKRPKTTGSNSDPAFAPAPSGKRFKAALSPPTSSSASQYRKEAMKDSHMPPPFSTASSSTTPAPFQQQQGSSVPDEDRLAQKVQQKTAARRALVGKNRQLNIKARQKVRMRAKLLQRRRVGRQAQAMEHREMRKEDFGGSGGAAVVASPAPRSSNGKKAKELGNSSSRKTPSSSVRTPRRTPRRSASKRPTTPAVTRSGSKKSPPNTGGIRVVLRNASSSSSSASKRFRQRSPKEAASPQGTPRTRTPTACRFSPRLHTPRSATSTPAKAPKQRRRSGAGGQVQTPRAVTPMTTRSKAKQEARLLNSSRKQRSTPMPTATPPADEALKLRRRQSERKKIRERKARELEQRVQNRQREMRDKEQADRCAREQRDSIMDSMKSRVQKRVRGLSYQQLCKEFMPKARLPAHPDKNTLRRNLRRAMAQYHPDRNGMRPVEQRVEAELIFEALKEAYEELCEFCGK